MGEYPVYSRPGGIAGRAVSQKNCAVRAVRAPKGLPSAEDFELVSQPVPRLAEGDVLFEATHMSLDPVMRRYLPGPDDVPGPIGGTARVGDIAMAAPPPPAHALSGAFVGTVLESRHPDFAAGDRVRGGHLWQTHHVVPGTSLATIPQDADPLDELGVLGGPGLVAWCGMRIAAVRPGETLVVSAAGGAIGMVAGQLGKAAGARVVGIASGEKAEYVVHELGFDACVDRRATAVADGLDEHCPEGIDAYFDNVGGDTGTAAFDRLRKHGRYILCGMAAEYNGPESAVGPPLRPMLRKRLRLEGFVVYDHYPEYEVFRSEMRELYRSGSVRYRYETLHGLDAAPAGLIRLLSGQNRGKMIVDLTGSG